MRILFEEHAAAQRAGGIEAATQGLIASLGEEGVMVVRSFTDADDATGMVPDCVHIHGIWSPVLARRFLHWRRRGVPCVVTVHGMLEPWALAHKRLKKQIAWHIYQKRLLNQASTLHATSEREAENLKKLGLKVPIAMIPWGVEMPEEVNVEHRTSNFELRTEERLSGFQDFSVSGSSPKTALFVGRIYPVKGLPLLVEAWAKVRPDGWKMKIVGPDEAGHRAEVEALVREAGLEEEFEFVGPLGGDALRQAYEEADLLLQPSHTENFGMAIAEAMSHGLPVITTHGAPWELLEEERCGWWVPVGVEGIAAALEEATRRGPEELAAMGARGRKVVAERFAWDGIAKQFGDCYRWLLGEREVPHCVLR